MVPDGWKLPQEWAGWTGNGVSSQEGRKRREDRPLKVVAGERVSEQG